MEALVPDGLLCLLQKDNFLYNRLSIAFRRSIFERWDVREILDFTPIEKLFTKAAKVVVVLAEARPPKPERPDPTRHLSPDGAYPSRVEF